MPKNVSVVGLSQIRNILRSVFTLALLLFTGLGGLHAQSVGKWQATNSSGSATATGGTILDVNQFSGDLGAATAACIAQLASNSTLGGGVCDARAFIGTSTISTQLVLPGTSTKPFTWLLNPNMTVQCTTAVTSPCIAAGDNVTIECGTSQPANPCLIQTQTTSQHGLTILGPSSATASDTEHLSIRGVGFYNSATNTVSTDRVVDLSNTSFAIIENSLIGHGGGTGDGLLVQISGSGTSAYYNSVMNTYFLMNGGGFGVDVEGGANELRLFGGKIQGGSCAVNAGYVNGLHLFGTGAEGYSDAAICSKPASGGSVYGVDWTGGRFEATGGVLIADVVPAGGTVSQFYITAPNINDTQGYNDPQHVISWLYGGPGFGGAPAIFGGINQPVSSGSGNLAGIVTLSGTTATVTFTPSFLANPACVATDRTGLNVVQVSSSTTTLTITGTSGHQIAYVCIGNPN